MLLLDRGRGRACRWLMRGGQGRLTAWPSPPAPNSLQAETGGPFGGAHLRQHLFGVHARVPGVDVLDLALQRRLQARQEYRRSAAW